MQLLAYIVPVVALIGSLIDPASAQVDLEAIVAQVQDSLQQTGALSILESILEPVKPQIAQLLNDSPNATFFAPSNAALEKFQKENPDLYANVTADPDWLADVLAYHFLPYVALDPQTAPPKSFPRTALHDDAVQVDVANKKDVTVRFDGGSAKVTESIPLENGVVHVIDTVLRPPRSVVEIAKEAGLTALIKAVQDANLPEDVAGLTNFTLFAPTNKAFDRIKSFAKKQKLDLTSEVLASILQFHVVPDAQYFSTDLPTDGKSVEIPSALKDEKLTVQVNKKTVSVSGAGTRSFKLPVGKVTKADILVKGGVVHVVDHVILPDLKTGSKNGRRSDSELYERESSSAGVVKVPLTVWALGVVAAIAVMM